MADPPMGRTGNVKEKLVSQKESSILEVGEVANDVRSFYNKNTVHVASPAKRSLIGQAKIWLAIILIGD